MAWISPCLIYLPYSIIPFLQLLSQSVRNRVYDGIATIISRSHGRGTMHDGIGSSSSNEEDRLTERCLYWILALLRGGGTPGHEDAANSDQWLSGCFREGVGIVGTGRMGISRRGSLADSMSGHTKRNLRESLDIVSAEKSKRGLLAALLVKHF